MESEWVKIRLVPVAVVDDYDDDDDDDVLLQAHALLI
jgi:hypothetical protein